MESLPKLDVLSKLAKLSKFLTHLVAGPHCLVTHGDHFVREPAWFDDDPLASPIRSYVDLHETDDGIEPRYIAPGSYYHYRHRDDSE